MICERRLIMKSSYKIIEMILTVLIILSALVGCNIQKTDNRNPPATNQGNTVSNLTSRTDEKKDNTSVTEAHTKDKNSQDDAGGAVPGLAKYRLIYYNVPLPFWDLVEDQDELQEWYENLLETSPNETNQMVMKAFLEHYNISREDFDKANLKWAKIVRDDFGGEPMMDPKDFANQETDEVFNGDIIYTFDDEVINEYYMGHPDEFYPYWYADEYEQAVKEGYVPRTTDWVDVGKMEADIIAKYGSVD